MREKEGGSGEPRVNCRSLPAAGVTYHVIRFYINTSLALLVVHAIIVKLMVVVCCRI